MIFEFQCPIDFHWDFLAPIDVVAQRMHDGVTDFSRSSDHINLGAFLQRITTLRGSGDFTEDPRVIALPASHNQINLCGFVWKEDGGTTYVTLREKYAGLAEMMFEGDEAIGKVTEIIV